MPNPLYLWWRQQTKLSIVFMLSSGPHSHHSQTHIHTREGKNLIGILFNPLAICKKHTRSLVANIAVRMGQRPRAPFEWTDYDDFDYHWGYDYHCRPENPLYTYYFGVYGAILFFYCLYCNCMVWNGFFLFAKQ